MSQNWPVQLEAFGDVWNNLEPSGTICDPAVDFRESEISLQTRIKSVHIACFAFAGFVIIIVGIFSFSNSLTGSLNIKFC